MKFLKDDEVEIDTPEISQYHRHRKMAKRVVTELVSQIPRFDHEMFNMTEERWNCGADCVHFTPAEEREKDTELDMCGAGTNVVAYKKKRCPFKEIHDELRIEPDWIDAEFSADEDEDDLKVPHKPKKERW